MHNTRLFFTRFLLISLLLAHTGIILAQSLQDIQNIKADELTDAQVEEIIRRAETSGLNEQQILSMARERGMPAGEIAKLRQRIVSIRSGKMRTGGSNQGASSLERVIADGVQQPDSRELLSEDTFPNLSPTQKKIFGFTLFHNRELNFNPSLAIPTPQNYVVGGGDQLLIDIYGASQQSYDVQVSPEGTILIPNVGSIQLAGATIAAANARVKSALTEIYSGLAGPDPNTFMELRLGNIRTVSVAMVGELNKPGNYTLPSFASPFNALFVAGGPNENGSFRHIQLYRDNRLLQEIDVYDFLVSGKNTANNTLRDNDVIIVPPVRSRVELLGPVRREGLFEVKPGESLEEVLAFAGGLASDAYGERITVTRKTGTELKVEDVDAAGFGRFIPQDGDRYRIGKILDRYENRVQIAGALMRPGTYALQSGMTVSQLIEKSGGLREDAFVNRATIYRTKPDYSLEIVSLDVQAILEGTTRDVLLRREDVLNIPSRYDIREEYYIKISGEVNNPGTFAHGENMNVADAVLKAGGFKESASASQIEIVRRVKDDISGKLAEIIFVTIDRNLTISGDGGTIMLNPFDHVIVRKSPGFQQEQLVSVEGEVDYPGEYALTTADERISDVLKRAGGLNQFAFARGATLIRKNEFFEAPSESEIKAWNLTSVKENISRDSLEQTAYDRILLNRINQKLDENRSDGNGSNGTLLSAEFRKQAIETISDADSVAIEVRTQEMVGIDLEAILRNPKGPEDLILKEGDVLSIPKELQTVRMRGELLYPTTARYRPQAGFKNYISRAGGFTDRSRKPRSYVIYANGDVRRTNRFLFFTFYPKIEPGAEIIVPRKPERQPMSVQSWIGLASSLATLAILVDRVSR